VANGRYGHRKAITPPHLAAVDYSAGKLTTDRNATRITPRRNGCAPDFTALILLHSRSYWVRRKRPRHALPARARVWRNCSALYRPDGETARYLASFPSRSLHPLTDPKPEACAAHQPADQVSASPTQQARRRRRARACASEFDELSCRADNWGEQLPRLKP